MVSELSSIHYQDQGADDELRRSPELWALTSIIMMTTMIGPVTVVTGTTGTTDPGGFPEIVMTNLGLTSYGMITHESILSPFMIHGPMTLQRQMLVSSSPGSGEALWYQGTSKGKGFVKPRGGKGDGYVICGSKCHRDYQCPMTIGKGHGSAEARWTTRDEGWTLSDENDDIYMGNHGNGKCKEELSKDNSYGKGKLSKSKGLQFSGRSHGQT